MHTITSVRIRRDQRQALARNAVNFVWHEKYAMSIIDVHSHYWQFPNHFSDDFRLQARRARSGVEVDLTVRFDDYQRQSVVDVTTIVFGGKARLSGLWVDDRDVHDYVAAHPDR